jgi:hypothetical protein
MRGLRLDRNPLRRGSDRAETAIVAGLVTAFLAVAPFTAVTAGHWVYAAGLHEQRAQAAAWHRVPALVLKDAPSDSFVDYGPSAVPVPARWAAPDGSQHTGYVGVPAGTRAGSSVTTWTDAAGRLTGPPLVSAQVADRAALAAMAAPLIAAILLLVAWMLARRALDKRRSAAWDAEWKVTGPQWTNSR